MQLHHLGGCGKRIGRHDNLIAWADTNCFECQMQRGSTRVDRERVGCITCLLETQFEFRRFFCRGEPATAKNLGNKLNFAIAAVKFEKGDFHFVKTTSKVFIRIRISPAKERPAT